MRQWLWLAGATFAAILVIIRWLYNRFNNVHLAARAGRVGQLYSLLQRDPGKFMSRNEDGERPLHLAAAHGRLEAVRMLLDSRHEIDVRANDDSTPLHQAAAGGHVQVIELLIARGAAIDSKNSAGQTPYVLAQANGHAQAAEVLAQRGADIDTKPWASRAADGMVSQIDHDDPVIRAAVDKARATVTTLRELYAKKLPAHVKFAFHANSGTTEHIWCELLDLSEGSFKGRIATPPRTHKGAVDPVQVRPIGELEDWQVELPDGRIRGGFTQRAMLQRIVDERGALPPALLHMWNVYAPED